MKFNLLVTGALYSTQSSYSALSFCRAAVEQGHTISQVFFYADGVTQASSLVNPLSDEFDAVTAWNKFAKQTQVDLVVCISAAERRGVMDDEQAMAEDKKEGNLNSRFRVAGLGELHAASLESDRTVSFK